MSRRVGEHCQPSLEGGGEVWGCAGPESRLAGQGGGTDGVDTGQGCLWPCTVALCGSLGHPAAPTHLPPSLQIIKKLIERKQAQIRKVYPGLTCFKEGVRQIPIESVPGIRECCQGSATRALSPLPWPHGDT